jgi:glycine cleavage system H protein
VKTVADMLAPVSGKLVEINRILNSKPEVVNQDPYGEGWMIKLELTNMEEIDSLMDVEAYKKLIGA